MKTPVAFACLVTLASLVVRTRTGCYAGSRAMPVNDLGSFALPGNKARVARAKAPRSAEFPRYGRGTPRRTAACPANRAAAPAGPTRGFSMAPVLSTILHPDVLILGLSELVELSDRSGMWE